MIISFLLLDMQYRLLSIRLSIRRHHKHLVTLLCLVVIATTFFIVAEIFFPRRLHFPRGTPARSPGRPAPFVFGLISDLQYADLPDGVNLDNGRPRFYRDSLDKLRRAVGEWNRYKVKCVVDLGDIIDASSRKQRKQHAFLNSIEMELSNLAVPYYHLLGNHDLTSLDFSEWDQLNHLKIRRSFPRDNQRDQSNFQFSFLPHPKIRFIFLNSFGFSVLGHASSKPKEVDEAWSVLRRNNPNKNPNSAAGLGSGAANRRWTAFNAAVGAEQRQWLQQQLRQARNSGEKVVCFCHVPLHPQVSKFIAWDYEEVLDILKEYQATILAVISGHDHDGAHFYDTQRNIAFVTLKGAVETNPGNPAHFIAQIFENKMTIWSQNSSVTIDSINHNLSIYNAIEA